MSKKKSSEGKDAVDSVWDFFFPSASQKAKAEILWPTDSPSKSTEKTRNCLPNQHHYQSWSQTQNSSSVAPHQKGCVVPRIGCFFLVILVVFAGVFHGLEGAIVAVFFSMFMLWAWDLVSELFGIY
jgi:hypothetical protein